VQETLYAVEAGAQEVDMVINVGALKSGDWDFVRDDIAAVVKAAKGKAHVKVIIETCLLTDEEKKKVCLAAKEAEADFVKTSTGFFTGGKSEGATYEIIAAMMEVADGRCQVKGSGGIRDREKFLKLIDMGIDRMGIGYKSTPVVLGLK